MTSAKALLALSLAGALAACSATEKPVAPPVRVETTAPGAIIATDKPLECVPYARQISGVSLRGDAWTWWQSAARHYRRDDRPSVGAVIVLKRTERLPYGHVAVVSRTVNDREILVDHANWLNRGRIHRGLPVRDVSLENDWSAVRVWYAPANTLGLRTYPAHGFIHPNGARALRLQRPLMQGPDVRVLQEALSRAGFHVSPDGIFGRETSEALVAFQKRRGLATDGVAGQQTRVSLGL